ncbi:DAK2 domain-containing protein, partial [Cellulomonas algicola]|uniref:DAK2 domain-containing protein n=1 Tax=Cellulomonas algicola TaxID=2071633 RepID=UPI001F1A44A9
MTGGMDVLDADVLRAWAGGARTALALARPAVDAVNVFPVADADTGTNALLTITGGAEAVAALPAGTGALAVARAFARGALLAARGNSGVILS